MNEQAKVSGGAVVKFRKVRVDQWTLAKRQTFLDHLAATCNVKESVKVVGMSTSGAFALRLRDPAFAEAWADALAQGYQHIEAQLLAQAIGQPADAASNSEARPFDPELGLRILQLRNASTNQRRPRGPRVTQAPIEQVRAWLSKNLDAMAKHLKVEL